MLAGELQSSNDVDDGCLWQSAAMPQLASNLGLRGLSPSHPTDFAVLLAVLVRGLVEALRPEIIYRLDRLDEGGQQVGGTVDVAAQSSLGQIVVAEVFARKAAPLCGYAPNG